MSNSDKSYELLLAEETLVIDVLEDLLTELKRQGLSQADLSRRLGVSRAAVNRIFNGNNLTVRTVARLAHAMGTKVRFDVCPNKVGSTNTYRVQSWMRSPTEHVYDFAPRRVAAA